MSDSPVTQSATGSASALGGSAIQDVAGRERGPALAEPVAPGAYPAHSVCRCGRHTECAGYITRRELGSSVIRAAALGGLALLSAVLWRRGSVAGTETSCRRAIACRQCAVLADCTLPQAAAEREQAR